MPMLVLHDDGGMPRGTQTYEDPVSALRRLGTVAHAATLRQVCDPWRIRVAVRDGAILQKVKVAPRKPVVTVPRGRKRAASEREGIDVRWATLPAAALHCDMVTTRVQTVIDCCRSLPFDEALCVVDSALRQGSVTKAELLAAAERSPRTGRQRATRVVELGDARADNPFESCLRAIAHDVPGLEFEPQVMLSGIGRADLVDVRLRLVAEAESIEFHNDEQSFRNDIRRYTAMVRHQWCVVRFCWEDVMFQQDYVRAVLTDLVAAGPASYGQFTTPGIDSRLGMGA